MGGDKLKSYVKMWGLQAFLRLQVMAWKKRRKVMRKKRGRLFGAVISAVLLTAEIAGVSGIAFGAKPMSAQAANEPVMQFGTAGIDDDEWISYGKKAEVYAQGTTIYRVLDADTDNAGDTGAMFVMSEGLWGTGGNFGNVYFDNTAPYSNVWQDSDAKGWCGDFYTANFGTVEKTAVKAVTKDDAAEEVFGISWAESSLNGENVFFLSAKEVSTYISATVGDGLKAKYGEDPGNWWLRSPYANSVYYAARVNDVFGNVILDDVEDVYAARPAFNVDTSRVLFSMAGEATKSTSSTPESVEYIDNIGTQGNPWTLTLLDDSMTVTPGVSSGFEDNDHKILLSNCTSTGDSNRISVMITDRVYAANNANGASIIYYGKLGEDKTFSIPAELDLDDWGTGYYIYLIAEKTGTGYASDYASLPTEVTAPGEDPVEPAVPSDNSKNKDSDKKDKHHVHEYVWETALEATAYTNGEYVYRCKICGNVIETETTDYTAALMNAMKAAIEAAPANGTVKMDCGYYVSLNSVVAAAHDARPDVTTIFTFIYRGDTYEITIPAGVAIVPSLNAEGWAGFMCIKDIDGVTIVKK